MKSATAPNPVARDLSDLLSTPYRPLTPDEKAHFDEYMAFKNHDMSAKNVDITDAANDIIGNFDYYMGLLQQPLCIADNHK